MVLSTRIRRLVSKKKRRFQQDGFDLDLTYITPNLVAMGYPSQGIEKMYRNSLVDVKRLLDTRHASRYMVYNLCSERQYDPALLDSRVARFPFPDHNPCPANVMGEFCVAVERYLAEHPANTAFIHCKAGKGRTGLMVCCYLLHSRHCATPAEAIEFYGRVRTKDGKGLTIPSQIRYVHYYYDTLLRGGAVGDACARLESLTLSSAPSFGVRGGCEPYVQVYLRGELVFQSLVLPHVRREPKREVTIPLGSPPGAGILLNNDCKIVVRNKRKFRKSGPVMFAFWFHPGFLKDDKLVLQRLELDKANKDKKHKHFDDNFSVSLKFSAVDNHHSRARIPAEGSGEYYYSYEFYEVDEPCSEAGTPPPVSAVPSASQTTSAQGRAPTAVARRDERDRAGPTAGTYDVSQPRSKARVGEATRARPARQIAQDEWTTPVQRAGNPRTGQDGFALTSDDEGHGWMEQPLPRRGVGGRGPRGDSDSSDGAAVRARAKPVAPKAKGRRGAARDSDEDLEDDLTAGSRSADSNNGRRAQRGRGGGGRAARAPRRGSGSWS